MKLDKSTVRLLLSASSLVSVLSITGYAIVKWQNLAVVGDVAFNDIIKAGLQIKVDQSRSEFQLALLMMGAVWTLMLAKSDETKIALADKPELIMFCCANYFLLSSCWFHVRYMEDIAGILAIAGAIPESPTIPDVLRSGFNDPYRFQQCCLSAGVVIGALTLLSAHKLK